MSISNNTVLLKRKAKSVQNSWTYVGIKLCKMSAINEKFISN